jgi:hypothetical protein
MAMDILLLCGCRNDMSTLLEKLDQWHDGIPKELLKQAVKERETVTPGLIASLEEVAASPQTFLDHPERNLYYWAAYLLAHFEEEKALPAMLNVVRLSGGPFNDVVADLVGEDGAMLLANVSGNKTEEIATLLHDSKVGEEGRIAAADALGMLCAWGNVDSEIVQKEFRKALETISAKQSLLGATIVNASMDLDFRELAAAIQAAFDREVVDRDIAEWDFVGEWLHDEDFQPPPPYLLTVQAIEDIVEFFEEKVSEEEMIAGFEDELGDEDDGPSKN